MLTVILAAICVCLLIALFALMIWSQIDMARWERRFAECRIGVWKAENAATFHSGTDELCQRKAVTP